MMTKDPGKRKRRMLSAALPFLLGLLLLAVPTQAQAAQKIKPGLDHGKLTIGCGHDMLLELRGVKGRIQWSSSDPKVAEVAQHYEYPTLAFVFARNRGKCTVTAAVGKKKYRCRVTVTKAGLSMPEISINAYQETGYTTVEQYGDNDSIRYPKIKKVTCSNPKLVTWKVKKEWAATRYGKKKKTKIYADRLEIKAIGSGTCTLTITTRAGEKLQCYVTTKVTKFDKESVTLYPGQKVTLKVVGDLLVGNKGWSKGKAKKKGTSYVKLDKDGYAAGYKYLRVKPAKNNRSVVIEACRAGTERVIYKGYGEAFCDVTVLEEPAGTPESGSAGA